MAKPMVYASDIQIVDTEAMREFDSSCVIAG